MERKDIEDILSKIDNSKVLEVKVKEELEKDGLKESLSSQLEALDKAIDMEKEEFLRLKKDEIIPFIEEEIVVRYYFQEAGVKVRIRYDDALKQALASPRIQQY